MKLRLYPNKDTVRGLLQEDLELNQKELNETQTKLDALNGSLLVSVGDNKTSFQNRLERLQSDRKGLLNRILILDAHSPPEVAVEIEL